MQKNLDLKGRLIRAFLGILLLTFAWWASSVIALLAALFTFYEAAASWCVVYQILGINHCPTSVNKK
jgi:hypothetical protein